MEQIVIAAIIIALGFYVFKFYPMDKGNVKKLALAAVFIILTAVCKRFLSFMIPLFGLESFKVGIEYLPLLVAGFILNPSYAFIIGLTSDLIGLILVPTSFPFFGFTLTTILVCVIPSLICEYSKKLNADWIQKIAIGAISVIGLSASLYIYQLHEVKISDTVYVLLTKDKVMFISLCIVLSLLFIGLICYLRNRINASESRQFAIWMFAVILTEIICTLCLTPLWLNFMYGIPFLVSFCIRVIKECFIIPLEIFLGYTIIKILKK